MRIQSAWISAVLALAAIQNARPADTPPQVQVAVVVLQPGATGRLKPFLLSKGASPKQGNRLQVWLSTAEASKALIVAFDGAGQIAYSDQPMLLSLEAGDQQRLPEPGGWKWEADGALRELDILLVDNQSPALPGLTQLVKAMHRNVTPEVRVRQATELRRMIDAMTPRAAATEYSPKTEPVILAGLVRGGSCIWCKDAEKVQVPPAGSWLVRQRFP